MEKSNEEIAIDLLRRLRGYVWVHGENLMVNAVYITPAQQLRNQADEIERKEALLNEVDNFLSRRTK